MSQASAFLTGKVSHWVASSHDRVERAQLDTDLHVDVGIVGGGLTGLWAAYYLTEQAPHLSVALLEAEHIGYGASGRNGGWLSHLLPGNRKIYASGKEGKAGVIRLQRAMFDAVREVQQVIQTHEMDVDAVQSGSITFARNPAAMARILKAREHDLEWGISADEAIQLSNHQVQDRINVDGVLGAVFHPVVVRLSPFKLVTELASILEGRGVRIFEHSPAVSVDPNAIVSPKGTLHATNILVCTEGYDQVLLGSRNVAAINSSMIVTEPLDADTWQAIGWQGHELIKDAAHTFVYGQRTHDGRIAVGGRGVPYRYASATGGEGRVSDRTAESLLDKLHAYFPGTRMELAHSWSGVLGVTRDWCTNINFDTQSGVGYARGYAGHGVTTAALAGRTLADLVLRRDTELVTLPWVGHRSPRWEPEPLRFIGVQAVYRTLAFADRFEVKSQSARTALIARIASRIGGMK